MLHHVVDSPQFGAKDKVQSPPVYDKSKIIPFADQSPAFLKSGEVGSGVDQDYHRGVTGSFAAGNINEMASNVANQQNFAHVQASAFGDQ